MLILQHNRVVVLDQRDSVSRPSNTHQFDTRVAAIEWIERTLDQLKQARYRVL